VAYTYLDAEVLSVDRLGIAPPPFVAGDPLLRRPRHHGWAEASWHGSAATLFVTAGARGRTLDIDPSFGAFGGLFENPGYASVDAGGAWHAGRGLEVFGRVTNLFDRGYEEVLGFPAPRRSLYAGVRFRVD
jgi:outer membrane receptor protein involved in Fe transport